MQVRGSRVSGEALADRDRQLSAVFEIARILATQQELETTLSAFLSSLSTTFEAVDAGVLLLYDPTDGRLRVIAAHGYDLTALSQIRLAPGESMSGKVFRSGQAEIYPTPESAAAAMADLSAENRDLLRQATVGGQQPLSAVSIPLSVGEVKVGVLGLVNYRRPGAFAPADLPFLRAVADLIALAMENARLRRELQNERAFQEANRLKAELISTLAHEMRTPLASIKGYSTALLMEEVSFSPQTQREFLQIIDEECDTLQGIIHDLLESSVIDAGLLKLELQPVMLARLAREAVDDAAKRSDKHHFLVDFPKDFPIVDADPGRIAQVLRNLLDNALKYSPQGGLIIVRGQVRPKEIVVSVADQGVGIAPEHLNRLFEKFFRAHSGLGRHVVGSGLGLPIARTIIESHGGRVWAESELGQGSTFYFTIPREGLSRERAEEESETDE